MPPALETAHYAPTRGRFRLRDRRSAHALDIGLQRDAEALEEPPEHMKFILATTDPQKIPVRCSAAACSSTEADDAGGDRVALQKLLSRKRSSSKATHCAHRARRFGQHADALSLLDQAIATAAARSRREACGRDARRDRPELSPAHARMRRRDDASGGRWRSPTRCIHAAFRSTPRSLPRKPALAHGAFAVRARWPKSFRSAPSSRPWQRCSTPIGPALYRSRAGKGR